MVAEEVITVTTTTVTITGAVTVVATEAAAATINSETSDLVATEIGSWCSGKCQFFAAYARDADSRKIPQIRLS